MTKKLDDCTAAMDSLRSDAEKLVERCDALDVKRRADAAGGWDESKHKRGAGGKFGSGGGGGSKNVSFEKAGGMAAMGKDKEGRATHPSFAGLHEKELAKQTAKAMKAGASSDPATNKANQKAYLKARDLADDEREKKLAPLTEQRDAGKLSESKYRKLASGLEREYAAKVKEAQAKHPFTTSRPGLLD